MTIVVNINNGIIMQAHSSEGFSEAHCLNGAWSGAIDWDSGLYWAYKYPDRKFIINSCVEVDTSTNIDQKFQ